MEKPSHMALNFAGYYHDGETSARRKVRIFPSTRSLHLQGEDGERLEEWPYRGLRLAEEVYHERPFRLRHKDKGEAALTVTTPELLKVLEQRLGRKLRQHWLMRPSPGMVGVWSLGLIAVVAVFWFVFPLAVSPLARLVPLSWEKALGEKVIAGVANEASICTGAPGLTALETLTARLTRGIASPYPLRVRISGIKMVNAFAAPGGNVVIMRGLLEAAETPEEVAGVLAHEIAHSVERHPMQGMIRAMGIGLVFGMLTGDTSALDGMVSNVGQLLLIFSYTRKDELAADRIGVAMLNRADIRGQGLLEFFRRLKKKQGGGGTSALPALFSTHPLHEERIALIESTATGRKEAMTEAEWQSLRAICG